MIEGFDEQERLRVLRSFEILDTDEEAAFDDFTMLVSHLLKVPIALISLVDERRQWFKSYVGLEVRETDRDVAFCDVAIRGSDALIVPDARLDVRFSSNPLVLGDPRIRFYAGVPLRSSEGQALGTLCAIDTQPRELTDSEEMVLQVLARQVMAQLELRRVTARRLRAEIERLKVDAKLQGAQRLESLAVLAGGIAHDFNNLLVSILGNANLSAQALPMESPVRESIARIETAARRAAELTKQMLAYSGTGNRSTSSIDVSKLVEELTHLLEVAISRKVVLQLDLAREGCSILGEATQIRQVLMNLLVNASDAIGDRSGIVAIRTGCTRLGSDDIAATLLPDYASPGEFTYVEVADDGCGMTPDVQGRMFDPFYSGKERGRGLGLAAVLGIVRSHGGTISVSSEVDRGTTVRVLLPTVEADEELAAGALPKRRGSGEVVLVVDDEEHVRAVATRMLELLGFCVTVAPDGREAVARYENDGEGIDLVLMDMTMPHMSGLEAFRAIRHSDPDSRVVLMSGHSREEICRQERVGFLQKPFSTDDLLDAVMAVLEQ